MLVIWVIVDVPKNGVACVLMLRTWSERIRAIDMVVVSVMDLKTLAGNKIQAPEFAGAKLLSGA